ncbi:Protein NARROW LEAF 1 [Linum perenne]
MRSSASEDSALDTERNNGNSTSSVGLTLAANPSSSMPSLTLQTTLHPYAPHSESNAAYFSWPTSSRLNDAAEERANYFANLQKGVLPESLGRLPQGQRATTLLELMTIRAFHSKILRCYSLGTAIGFRIRRGLLTDVPAILVFVSRKVHKQWLTPIQCLPNALEGPGGVWCDVDVLEFSYFGAPEPAPKEQLYTDIVDDLRGGNLYIGSGSQVASQETYGTLGAIVRSQTGSRQVGFLTNRHVAVDLDYPNQKMFHPLPPTLGPGVYLGAVERATSFITDDLWYAIFAGSNPDGAFIPFADDFDLSTVTTSVKGVGEVGSVKMIDLQSPISSLIGKQVMKVGRSSGLTTGTVLAYALEYNDEKGICFFTDFLVVGTNQQTFDLEGDSGSMIMMKGSDDDDDGEKPRPIGIIWGGTANRGRLKLKVGQPPENWTSGVDLGRLLTLLELDLITTTQGLKVAIQEQRAASATGIGSTVEDLSPADGMIMREKDDDTFESLGLQIQHIPPLEVAVDCNLETQLPLETDDDADDEVKVVVAAPPSVEHQFIPNFGEQSALHQESQADKPKNLASLRSGECEDGEEEEETMMISVSLKLGDNNNECKRKRSDVATGDDDEVN